jgi:Zn-dependent M28 family amino/carboxypeptidase
MWFQTHGADEVDMQPFVMPNGTPSNNIVAVHKGTKKPNEVIVVGAHMDSTSNQGSSLAPGAVDNGSGTVGVMMISQAMSQMNFDRTVHLVAFSGEEQVLLHYCRRILQI